MTPPPPKPKPTRGMPRSLLYALIPGGFLLIVLILVFTGFFTQEVTDDAPGVMDQPPAPTQQAPDQHLSLARRVGPGAFDTTAITFKEITP